MKFKFLHADDATRLLQFELENRDWFEQHIEPRSPSFYSLDGVAAHIRENLASHDSGALHPYLLLSDEDEIVGRANLKDIDCTAGTALIGYRIAQHCIGQGLASTAVEYLKQVAFTQLGLVRIAAYVSTENPASTRVLEKNDFVRADRFPGMAVRKDRTLDCDQYVCARPTLLRRPMDRSPDAA